MSTLPFFTSFQCERRHERRTRCEEIEGKQRSVMASMFCRARARFSSFFRSRYCADFSKGIEGGRESSFMLNPLRHLWHEIQNRRRFNEDEADVTRVTKMQRGWGGAVPGVPRGSAQNAVRGGGWENSAGLDPFDAGALGVPAAQMRSRRGHRHPLFLFFILLIMHASTRVLLCACSDILQRWTRFHSSFYFLFRLFGKADK